MFYYYNFSSNWNSTLKFCMVLCNAIEKSYAKKKWRKSIRAIPMYTSFSYTCGPKPVGRIDPSRLEKDNRVEGGKSGQFLSVERPILEADYYYPPLLSCVIVRHVFVMHSVTPESSSY